MKRTLYGRSKEDADQLRVSYLFGFEAGSGLLSLRCMTKNRLIVLSFSKTIFGSGSYLMPWIALILLSLSAWNTLYLSFLVAMMKIKGTLASPPLLQPPCQVSRESLGQAID